MPTICEYLDEIARLEQENKILIENRRLAELDLREAQEQLNDIRNNALKFFRSLGVRP